MAYANSVDPDHSLFTSSLIRVYTVCHSTEYFMRQLHKMQNLGQNICNKVLEILGHLPYNKIYHQMLQTIVWLITFVFNLLTLQIRKQIV